MKSVRYGLIAIAMMILSAASIFSAGQQKQPSSWSKSHKGLIKLAGLLKTDMEVARISNSDANNTFVLASQAAQDQIMTFAKEYRRTHDLGALRANLTASINSQITPEVVPGPDCGALSGAYYWGCFTTGGDVTSTYPNGGACSTATDVFYCDCLGGAYDPSSGLCF